MAGICRNVCRDARRRKRDVLVCDGVLDGPSAERCALRVLREQERESVVIDAIETLPHEERDILFHRYIHELPRQQIAVLLGIEVDVVRVRLQSASRHLRKALGERLEELGSSFFHVLSEQSATP